MEPKNVFLAGVLMTAWGGFLLFHGLDALPLWVVWTVGPLCWYLGSAIMLVGGSISLHGFLKSRGFLEPAQNPAGKTAEKQVLILRFKEMMPANVAPAGVIHEIPPMGGFVY